ncbi:AAA family ATPase [Comamonas testosteroni]|uniref:Recombination protein F n=1 Tax=Comamonas testosteroni TaxID=285 RepID=A0A8B4S730_COMTE|nr:AAA family ATPase [Comamonas testosteroni]EHN65617.1 ATP-dependent OLD family endonuclease [Comamonas testosteroni ATCC 11996]QQN68387.1 AAA family ATPase [Comamonas testosteroni]SUY78358.1 recombination protein F [Comamonas testosteroni]
MDFEQLKLHSWQQFAEIDISFHPRATILTGANGSGKTTILSLLARHRGWHQQSLATPKNDFITKALKYFSLFRSSSQKTSSDRSIGALRYSNGSTATLIVPEAQTAQYQVAISNQQPARFFYIPSHRQTFSYRRVGQINTIRKERQTAFDEIQHNQMSKHAGHHNDMPSSFLMKNTLLGWMINGYGVRSPTKTIMPPDPLQIRNFEGFRDALRLILPQSLGFEDLEVRDYEIVFICNGGADEFLLETASGGISALIDIAWQIFMFDTDEKAPFTVVIDEVENHLHPSMQRTLLPSLLSAFPHAKFIVTTHSPLIVTSVEDANVYALRYDHSKKVRSYLLDFKTEVMNAIDVLDEVLGVSTTLPPWAVDKLSSILERHSVLDPTSESMTALRIELGNAGLSRLFPEAVGRIAEARK